MGSERARLAAMLAHGVRSRPTSTCAVCRLCCRKLGRGFNTSAGPARRGGGAARSRRIKKIESGILRLDASIRSIDAKMTDKGFDVGALLQLQAQRGEVSSKIGAFIAERERLEAQPWALCAGGPDGLPEESSQDTEQERAREGEEVGTQLLPRPLPPLVDPDGRKGRIVLNHSTHVPPDRCAEHAGWNARHF